MCDYPISTTHVIDMESMKHQLEVLNVLRPKVFPPKLAVTLAADATVKLEDAEKNGPLDHCADVEKAAEDELIDEVERICDDVDCENVGVAGFEEETIAEDAGSNEAKE